VEEEEEEPLLLCEIPLGGATLAVGAPVRAKGSSEWGDEEPCGFRLVLACGRTLRVFDEKKRRPPP
jgi:hypothetical protein